jgi:hypothetical protein
MHERRVNTEFRRPPTREHCRARGAACTGSLVALGESDAFRRESIKRGRSESLIAVTTQIAPTEVIGDDQEHIGTTSNFGG